MGTPIRPRSLALCCTRCNIAAKSRRIVAYDGGHSTRTAGLAMSAIISALREVIGHCAAAPRSAMSVCDNRRGRAAQRAAAVRRFRVGGLAICHNGNLTNSYQLRRQPRASRSPVPNRPATRGHRPSDCHEPQDTVVDRLTDALRQVSGAYSWWRSRRARSSVCATHRVRPLGPRRLGDAWILSSRRVRWTFIGAEFERASSRGKLSSSRRRVRSVMPSATATAVSASFEHIYFARPTAIVEGQRLRGAQTHRRRTARESHVDADIVVPVPIRRPGGARVCSRIGIAFELGIIRNHYGRTDLIEPTIRSPPRRSIEA